MNFILDVVVLREQLKEIEINEVYFEWGGEKISQEPRKYEYENLLQFKEVTVEYYNNSNFAVENCMCILKIQ